MATKVTEEQIVAILRDPQYTSERQRAIALWTIPSGSHIKKFKELRKKYSIPEPEPGKKGRVAVQEKLKDDSDVLKFDDIRKDDRLMKGKKRFIVLATSNEEILLRRMDGSSFSLSRKLFDRTASEYTKVPPGDPQGGPVTSYIDPSLKAGDIKVSGQPIKNLPDSVKEKIIGKLKEEATPTRKPATINQDFEAAVQEMEEEHAARKEKEPTPCVHFTQDCGDPELDNCEECPDYQDELAESEPEPDYIDPEWGVIDAKPGTIEFKMLSKAHKEIAEYQKARKLISDALESGGRLPTQYVNTYNRIVTPFMEVPAHEG